jgi:hypothetical protein
MSAKIIIFASLCLFIAGCEDKPAKPAEKSPAQIEISKASETPKITPEDWKKSIKSTYVESKTQDEGDGVESFFACFEPTPEKVEKCKYYAFGERDTFRKIRIYMSGFSTMQGSSLSSYVSLPDNKKPLFFLAPYIFSSDSWIFINKIAIMVDGEVILEKDFDGIEAQRNVIPDGVQERVDFVATPEQIDSLRKIKPDSKILIRVTGEKGYIILDKRVLSHNAVIINAIGVYDALNNAVKDKIPEI